MDNQGNCLYIRHLTNTSSALSPTNTLHTSDSLLNRTFTIQYHYHASYNILLTFHLSNLKKTKKKREKNNPIKNSQYLSLLYPRHFIIIIITITFSVFYSISFFHFFFFFHFLSSLPHPPSFSKFLFFFLGGGRDLYIRIYSATHHIPCSHNFRISFFLDLDRGQLVMLDNVRWW